MKEETKKMNSKVADDKSSDKNAVHNSKVSEPKTSGNEQKQKFEQKNYDSASSTKTQYASAPEVNSAQSPRKEIK